MSLTTAQKWLRTIAWLRRNFPARKPVRIRSVPIKKFHGYTEYDNEAPTREFEIKINEYISGYFV